MSLQVKLSSSSLQLNTLLNSNSSIHFDSVKTFILNEGQVRRGDDEYYLVLYERFSTMAEVKQVLRRHGIDTLSGNFDQLYRFYQAFEAGSRTMFICDSVSDLREPVILNCSSISRISPENVNEGGKYGFRVEVDGRIFQFHTNTKEELLSWIKAFKKPLPKNRKIKAQAAEEEEEYLGSEVEFDCVSVHAPTDLAAYYRFGSPPSMKKWKKGIAKPFKMVFKAVKKGIIDHNAITHNKRPKHKALPKIGSGQSKHVFAPRLPMLVNWGENLWILTERYQLWLLGLESGQWLKNFPKKPPQRFKCLTVCNECLFGLTLRGELWCLQLTKKYKLRQDHPEVHEWISDWPQKAPTAFQVIYGQKNKLFGLTETGVLWGC
ncbi:hypothetical protein K7432_014744 [Basidiobolus ranarum]|uniref:PH domain-containing protein n=1 Tax=Basidiobolus ranarum TaxID=34480 RepID=A0ABR2WH96_9FUNG